MLGMVRLRAIWMTTVANHHSYARAALNLCNRPND